MKDKEWLKKELVRLKVEADAKNEFGSNYTDEQLAIKRVFPLIDQLDEPELPVIPQFVADWIEYQNTGRNPLLWAVSEGSKREAIADWLFPDNYREKVNREDLLLRAWLDGYTIEKEKQPTWLVKLCHAIGGKTPYYCINGGTQFCLFDSDWTNHKEDAYHFTDKDQADMVAKLINGDIEEVAE